MTDDLASTPLEILLTSGGDTRLIVDPRTGLNGYGCSPRPRPWAITFASTTATSISDGAFAAAMAARERLLAAGGDIASAVAGEMDAVRSSLRQALALGSADVALCPSGTDGELYALQIARGRDRGPFVNILIGPDETGSGVVKAAAGRHFASGTAIGHSVEIGSAIDDLATNVEIVAIDLRSSDGLPRPMPAIDADVIEAVERAVARGARVLLHLVDSSKTGLGGPSRDVARQLKSRHDDHLDVVVDACQMRLSKEGIGAYLDWGFMVLFTASKFLTAPPFAAALLVPPAPAARMRRLALSSPGLGAYVGVGEWPIGWPFPHLGSAPRANVGLMLRWQAGLHELAEFTRVPRDRARTILDRFIQALRRGFEARPSLRLVPGLSQSRPEDPIFDRLDTILTFEVLSSGKPLALDELKILHRLINADLGAGLLGRRCHVGQPVRIGTGGALRLAAGARLVYGVDHGGIPLESEIADALTALDKICLLASDWPRWRDVQCSPDIPPEEASRAGR